MRLASGSRLVLASAALAAGAACGGGGYGGGGGRRGPSLGLFVSSMTGAAEPTVVDAAARGTSVLRVANDGHVDFAVTGDAAWTASVTGLDVRVGHAGETGSSVANLLGGGATFDPVTRTVSGAVTVSRSVATAILGNPSNYYVEARTAAAPQGLLRDQTTPFPATEWHAVLDGSLESPVADATARGGAALRVGTDGTAAWVVAMGSPAVASVTAAHVREGEPGVSGAVLVDLGAASATVDGAAGTLSGSLALPLDVMSRIAFEPGAFFVDVATAAAPSGVARGQVRTGPEELWCPLRGNQEPVIVDAAARGGAALRFDTFTSGHAYLAVPVSQGIASVVGATVAVGAPGATGPTLLDLMAGTDFATSATTGTAEGSLAYDQATYARLIGDPGAFYAHFSTAAAPAGLVRGRLTRSPQTVSATLAGGAQVPPADPSALGQTHIVFTGIHACSWSLQTSNPATSAVNGFHVHEGAAGVNGPVLVDLLASGGSLVGGVLSGDAVFTGGTFSRVLADPPAFYANAHTLAAPDGVARGQLTLLTEDVPPAGLAYTTPVVYTTGTTIPPNVPSSTGGSVASYSVTPSLPAGLALDPATGVIQGTPTAPAAAADYVVKATNASGFSQATVHVTVNVSAPAGLAYTTPVVYVVGTAISANTPSSTGGAIASYGVSPALPAGLSLDTTTGVISGTPTASAAAADYVVTGTNVSGSTPATVNIRVDAALTAPSGLSYTTPNTYTTGTAITANSPTVGGGPVASYAVSPALPAGLSLNTTTGVVTGTPTAVTAQADYVVTASNTAGFTQATVRITVVLGAPTNIQYDYTTGVGYVSSGTFSTMTPTAGGGTVASWSIAPTSGSYSLPAGLTFNTSTGVISGTPTTANFPGTNTSFTVTATNSAGSTTATVTVIVY